MCEREIERERESSYVRPQWPILWPMHNVTSGFGQQNRSGRIKFSPSVNNMHRCDVSVSAISLFYYSTILLFSSLRGGHNVATPKIQLRSNRLFDTRSRAQLGHRQMTLAVVT
jgi:hypothetical protein